MKVRKIVQWEDEKETKKRKSRNYFDDRSIVLSSFSAVGFLFKHPSTRREARFSGVCFRNVVCTFSDHPFGSRWTERGDHAIWEISRWSLLCKRRTETSTRQLKSDRSKSNDPNLVRWGKSYQQFLSGSLVCFHHRSYRCALEPILFDVREPWSLMTETNGFLDLKTKSNMRKNVYYRYIKSISWLLNSNVDRGIDQNNPRSLLTMRATTKIWTW